MYSREVQGKELEFGVSGMLYKSNVLMYDRETESLWSQVKRSAVAGPMTGTPLTMLASSLTTWKKWKERYPETEVLSIKTGYVRDYSRDPYESYYEGRRGFLSFLRPGASDDDKRLVAGVTIEEEARAYPLDAIREKGNVTDTLGGKKITLSFAEKDDVLTVRDSMGKEVPAIVVYWFVWKDFYPASNMYAAEGE